MSKLLYHLFLFTYQAGIRLLSPWNAKAALWIKGRKNFPSADKKNKQTVWMHCASLGEFEQGRPLLESIKKQYPASSIILTFFSPSGYEIMKGYKGADYIFYLPMDGKTNAKKMIDAIEPSLVLWVKYEFWYYYLTEFKQRNIPVLMVSGIFRDSQPFFKWYGAIWKKMLSCFTYFFVQNEECKDLLNDIGIIKNVSVSGDTRFDRVIEIAEKFQPLSFVPRRDAEVAEGEINFMPRRDAEVAEIGIDNERKVLPLIEKFCGSSKVIVAGSTWQEDEEELAHYVKANTEIKFILAPHEIDAENLKDVKKRFPDSIFYSALADYYKAPITNHQLQTINNVLIIDNIGMLSRLYQYAHITFVGGGFGSDGIHNVLEAAVYGKPVIYGPSYEKFAEAVELIDCGAGISIDNALELEWALNELWSDEKLLKTKSEAAKNYVYAKAGATKKIMDYIQANRLLTN